MRLLLDTHVLLWRLSGARTLGEPARSAIGEASELLFSVVSFAEIGVKVSIGKLAMPDGIHEHIFDSGVRILGLGPEHGLAVARLPPHHRDPFDRLLIAQARAERAIIVSADERFGAYDVALIGAR